MCWFLRAGSPTYLLPRASRLSDQSSRSADRGFGHRQRFSPDPAPRYSTYPHWLNRPGGVGVAPGAAPRARPRVQRSLATARRAARALHRLFAPARERVTEKRDASGLPPPPPPSSWLPLATSLTRDLGSHGADPRPPRRRPASAPSSWDQRARDASRPKKSRRADVGSDWI
jgi:hypothetical protein